MTFDKQDFFEGLLTELSFRVEDGIPDLKNPKHLKVLGEIFDDMELYSVGGILIRNLLNEQDGYKHIGAGIYVADRDVDSDGKAKDGAKKYRKDGEGESASYTPISDDEAEEIKKKQGEEGEKAASAYNKSQEKGDDGELVGDEQPEEEEPKGAKVQGSDMFSHAPDVNKKEKNTKTDSDEPITKKIEVPQEKIGKVEEGGDSQAKNDVLEYGYKNYEKKTGKKPAPGGSGSAFNEITSEELIHVLEKNPNMTEEELADYCQKRFGGTTLGKEQKETAGISRNPELEKKRKAAIGNGTTKKPEFPKLLKEVEQERATYSKSRIAARSAKAKFERSQQRVSNLQTAGKFGKETKLHTFYGADDSLSAQVDMVDNVNKVLLPDGTEVDKEDMKEFIKQGGGGMNPSDTATFVTDENGNLLVQFHSDKTTTADIQDNSTLAKEEDLYKSYIERTSLSDEDKQKANKINSEYADKIIKIEEEYNNQSKGIAEGLLRLDLDKQANIVDNDGGTLQKNLDIAIYGETAYKRDDFDSITSELEPYLPDGVSQKDLTNKQKLEMLYRFAADGGKLTGVKVKPINKVALQYEKENTDAQGINVKTILSKQRESVVKLQRERIDMLNNFNSDVDGVSVPVGTLMEAEENIRGFHLTLMDYPPKEYTKGDPSSIVGTALDINMGGIVVTGQTLRECLGVQNTTEFKQKFTLVNQEKLTTDDPRGYPYGNVTGKVVHTYMMDVDGNKKEIGYKTYRSKSGATGKTNNTMSYSNEMQDCFKLKQK
jgi:hypothetical protein